MKIYKFERYTDIAGEKYLEIVRLRRARKAKFKGYNYIDTVSLVDVSIDTYRKAV